MRLAVAVSGGADSIALLLHAAETIPREEIVALAVDHGTRPAAAAAERRHAARVACRLQIRFHTLQARPDGRGHAHWRAARLAALTGFCRDHGIGRLWLGQHADDAVETAAIRLLADGPLDGLAGISALRMADGVRIERPLLYRSARAIRRGLMAAGFGWTEDPSNRHPAYKRAAVRQVLASLPGQRDANLDRIRRIAAWRVARERLEAEAWALAARVSPLGAVAFDGAALAALPASLRARLLRKAALRVCGTPDRLRQADFDAAARKGPPAQLGGAMLVGEGAAWWLVRRADSIAGPQPLAADMVWDGRCRITLAEPLSRAESEGGWTVAAVGNRRIGAMHRLAPAAVLAALPAVERGGRIVAIPHLGIWRGPLGPRLAAGLRCEWLEAGGEAKFHLVQSP